MGILVLYNGLTLSVLRFGEVDFVAFLLGEIHRSESQGVDCQTTTENRDARTFCRCIGLGCQMRPLAFNAAMAVGPAALLPNRGNADYPMK